MNVARPADPWSVLNKAVSRQRMSLNPVVKGGIKGWWKSLEKDHKGTVVKGEYINFVKRILWLLGPGEAYDPNQAVAIAEDDWELEFAEHQHIGDLGSTTKLSLEYDEFFNSILAM